MTVIAAASLFNGVMLSSDCRVTIKTPGKPDIHSDIVQKLFPLTSTSVIGFSGNVTTASRQLLELFRQLPRRRRRDPISQLNWLPRFFRASYSALQKRQLADPVHYMVAAVMRDRLNIVERQKVVDLMNAIAYHPSAQRSWMPGIIISILSSPPAYSLIALPETVAGLVYKLASPLFVPHFIAPLEFSAIGSGHQSTIELQRNADWIIGGEPGNDFIESTAFTSAIEQFIVDKNIIDVGGMYPCLKVDQRGVLFLGVRHSFPLYELSLRYDIQRKRWRQENLTTGKTIELLYPWEILADSIKTDMTFNDMREALHDFRTVPAHSRNET